MSHRKAAVGICARHEHKYIQECICFNYLQGWDKIVVCLHVVPEDTEPDRTRAMIAKLPPEVLSKVTVIESLHEAGWGFQHKGYHYILQEVLDCEWLGMFDVDECLYDSQKRDIHDLLATVPDDAGQIILPWVEFGHSNRVISATPQETRLAAFTTRIPLNPRTNFKAIVRTRNIVQKPDEQFPSNYWYYAHMARVTGRHVNFQGEDVVPPDFSFDGENFWKFWEVKANTTCFDPCLVHYFTGSMEDWVLRAPRCHFNQYHPRDVKMFMDYTGEVEDTRMSIYTEELRALLAKATP